MKKRITSAHTDNSCFIIISIINKHFGDQITLYCCQALWNGKESRYFEKEPVWLTAKIHYILLPYSSRLHYSKTLNTVRNLSTLGFCNMWSCNISILSWGHLQIVTQHGWRSPSLGLLPNHCDLDNKSPTSVFRSEDITKLW